MLRLRSLPRQREGEERSPRPTSLSDPLLEVVGRPLLCAGAGPQPPALPSPSTGPTAEPGARPRGLAGHEADIPLPSPSVGKLRHRAGTWRVPHRTAEEVIKARGGCCSLLYPCAVAALASLREEEESFVAGSSLWRSWTVFCSWLRSWHLWGARASTCLVPRNLQSPSPGGDADSGFPSRHGVAAGRRGRACSPHPPEPADLHYHGGDLGKASGEPPRQGDEPVSSQSPSQTYFWHTPGDRQRARFPARRDKKTSESASEVAPFWRGGKRL